MRPSHLCKAPGFLACAGDFLTVEELRVSADFIIHHTASVFASASQRTQEKITLLSVAAQL